MARRQGLLLINKRCKGQSGHSINCRSGGLNCILRFNLFLSHYYAKDIYGVNIVTGISICHYRVGTAVLPFLNEYIFIILLSCDVDASASRVSSEQRVSVANVLFQSSFF